MPADLDLLVRRITPDDGPLLRDLRLEALADTPLAFCERLQDARLLDDAAWRDRAARGAIGGDCLQLLVLDGARAVATAKVFADDGRAWLAAVYVSPAVRGAGLPARLVEGCSAWAREQGFDVLLLEVHEDNPRARAAYARLGFAQTGRSRPYPLDPTARELEMALALG